MAESFNKRSSADPSRAQRAPGRSHARWVDTDEIKSEQRATGILMRTSAGRNQIRLRRRHRRAPCRRTVHRNSPLAVGQAVNWIHFSIFVTHKPQVLQPVFILFYIKISWHLQSVKLMAIFTNLTSFCYIYGFCQYWFLSIYLFFHSKI